MASLTRRQKEIILTAMAHGYFEFPRRISLTGLGELFGVRPSTVSEILRSAERRLMASAFGAGAYLWSPPNMFTIGGPPVRIPPFALSGTAVETRPDDAPTTTLES